MATYEATRYSITGANITTNTIPAPSVVDGTVSNLEFSYINTLSSNAQTQLTAKASTTGATITGDFDFADDAKARFGDGNDLQIYHDGSNSYIKNGTGYIKFLEDNYQFNNNADSATFLSISSSGLTGVGTGLTALNATNLGSGTVPDARFPATLPAVSAANLTSVPAANLTGTAAAINGSNITSLNGTNIASGTVADARISTLTSSKLTGALPAIDGSALTGIDIAPSSGTEVGAIREVCIYSSGSTPTSYTINVNTTITPGTYDVGNTYVSDAPENFIRPNLNSFSRGFTVTGGYSITGKTRSVLTGTWRIIIPPVYEYGTTPGGSSVNWAGSSAGLMQRVS
tara:strand:- start:534 stop:1565 length:1032 start_codon:yes stop_codon:yes gene_type:complete